MLICRLFGTLQWLYFFLLLHFASTVPPQWNDLPSNTLLIEKGPRTPYVANWNLKFSIIVISTIISIVIDRSLIIYVICLISIWGVVVLKITSFFFFFWNILRCIFSYLKSKNSKRAKKVFLFFIFIAKVNSLHYKSPAFIVVTYCVCATLFIKLSSIWPSFKSPVFGTTLSKALTETSVGITAAASAACRHFKSLN